VYEECRLPQGEITEKRKGRYLVAGMILFNPATTKLKYRELIIYLSPQKGKKLK
jgi:hypothetical protein